MRMRALFVLSCLLLCSASGLQAKAVSSTRVPSSFLEGTFYFNTSVEGGGTLDIDLLGGSQLKAVRFVREDRFLVVYAAGDLYEGHGDATLSSVLARFPAKKGILGLKVSWGDDPTPFVMRTWKRQNGSWMALNLEAQGPHDVHDYVLDKKAGYLSFVKKLSMVSRETGETSVYRIRYNFLKQRETSFKPKTYRNQAEFDKFGYFMSSDQVLADKEAGYLRKRSFITRLDISKTFTFEIHPTVPEVCHKPIADAVESWNDVYEARCGVRPLRCKVGEPDHLPGDLRYHIIYFRGRGYSDGGYSAYGPSVAIAHTGEIVDADVIVDGTALMMGYKASLKKEQQEQAAAKKKAEQEAAAQEKESYGAKETSRPAMSISLNDHALPMIGNQPDHFTVPNKSLAGHSSRASGKLSADQAFYYLVRGLMCHEIGHNLGLRHNFAASNDFDNFGEGHIASSIMDYIWHDNRYYNPCPYDEAAIAFGYDGTLAEEEWTKYIFLTDEAADYHPLANMHDEGEPFAYYKSHTDYVIGPLLKGEKPHFSVRDGASYLDSNLMPIAKFINSMNDPRSEMAYQYFTDILSMSFPEESRYRAVPYYSVAKKIAGWYLLDLPNITGYELTRRQRFQVTQLVSDAIGDNETMLEKDRITLINRLARVKHVTAKRALEQTRDLLQERSRAGELADRQLEVEENVLMYVERALATFFDK